MSVLLTRRGFVVMAGTGLTLGWRDAALAAAPAGSAVTPPLVQPFVHIATDGRVTVLAKHLDMGQGVWTGLPTIVAEELDAAWSQMAVEGAPADRTLYRHTEWGVQATGGSTSIANSWDQLRRAGATARAMLVQAAAQRWGVPVDRIRVSNGVVSAGRSTRAGFGELAAAAAQVPVPETIVLKNPAQFNLIGTRASAPGRPAAKTRTPRLDAHAKSHGAPLFAIDVERPGMKVAVMQRPPSFGATLLSVDDSAARALPGVIDVKRVPGGVAVVAEHTWAALEGRRALTLQWDESIAEQRSSDDLSREFRRLAASTDPQDAGVIGLNRGDALAALNAPGSAARIVEAEYELPYLAHAAMEPLCSVGEWRDGPDGHGNKVCEVWAGFQNHTADHAALARILALPPERVQLHTLYAGGSFGRRATFRSDWISELAELLKATGGAYPIKLMWTREDDIRGGYYRPMNLHRLRAALAEDGSVLALEQVIVAQSFGGQPKPGTAQKLDIYAVEGHFGERYDVPNARLRWVNPRVGVPVHTFRALSYNHTTFTKEVFIDLLARRAGRDALEYRLAHLVSHPRQAAVLRLAAEQAGWGRPLPPGRALGLAVQQANSGTFVAQVAQVRLVAGGLQVERVVCAIDCGVAVNPDIVRAQIEGGIGDGLGMALHGRLSLDKGHVEQSNFHDYPLLRISEMPLKIDVHIIASDAAPTGVGEPGSVLIAAAVANALVALGGMPVRGLPLTVAARA